MGDKPKQWDTVLPHAEFAFNRTPNRSTRLAPFEIIYGRIPNGVLELAPIPAVGSKSCKADNMTAEINSIHKLVQQRIQESNAKYKVAADQHRRRLVLKEGDSVWAVLTKERFPAGEYNKLSKRKIGPCKVLKRINDNAYQIELPNHLRTSDVFNVKHLLPYYGESSEDEG